MWCYSLGRWYVGWAVAGFVGLLWGHELAFFTVGLAATSAGFQILLEAISQYLLYYENPEAGQPFGLCTAFAVLLQFNQDHSAQRDVLLALDGAYITEGNMQAIRVGPIVLIALAILMPSAKAEQHPIFVTLAQTVKPTTHTYPGVKADILGIRIGMTVSQAEAIAAKTYSGKPHETKNWLSTDDSGISAQSQIFISKVEFRNKDDDILTLYFSNPTAGNVIYAIDRTLRFSDASKAPLMTVRTSNLIKKYGPTSNKDTRLYIWQFGGKSLKPCPLGQCGSPGFGGNSYESALKMGVAMEISASISPGVKNTVQYLGMNMEDYQLKSESMDAGMKQIKSVAIEASQYYKTQPESKAEQKLMENADSLLDVTGTVTGHALVVSCGRDYKGGNDVRASISAQTVSSAGSLSKEVIQKYGLGPVTYDDDKYNMKVWATRDESTHITNAYVELDPVNYGKKIQGGGTLADGSLAIDVAGYSTAFTFDHTVLKLWDYPNVPPGSTVTINGKAYCNRNGTSVAAFAPWNRIVHSNPPAWHVPAQAMTGTYVTTADTRGAGSLDFVSGTLVNIHSPQGEQQATYESDGHQLLISARGGTAPFTIESDGCIDGPDNSKFCKK